MEKREKYNMRTNTTKSKGGFLSMAGGGTGVWDRQGVALSWTEHRALVK